jgi:hypothetical protein
MRSIIVCSVVPVTPVQVAPLAIQRRLSGIGLVNVFKIGWLLMVHGECNVQLRGCCSIRNRRGC